MRNTSSSAFAIVIAVAGMFAIGATLSAQIEHPVSVDV
jgi:hypothetical protein